MIVRRGRGAVALIGRANSARVGARFLPVFATVTGLAIALFASSILATQQHGLTDAGVGLIGADMRISAGRISERRIDQLRALPGVEDLTTVTRSPESRWRGTPRPSPSSSWSRATHRRRVRPLAAETAVSATRHAARRYPVAYGGGFLQPLGAQPSLQSPLTMPVSAIEEEDPPPKFVSNSPWILLDRTAIPDAQRGLEVQDSVLIRVTPGADPDRVTRSIRAIIGNGPLIDSALGRVRDLTASPLVPGLTAVALAAHHAVAPVQRARASSDAGDERTPPAGRFSNVCGHSVSRATSSRTDRLGARADGRARGARQARRSAS